MDTANHHTLDMLRSELIDIEAAINETSEWKATEMIRLELMKNSLLSSIKRILN